MAAAKTLRSVRWIFLRNEQERQGWSVFQGLGNFRDPPVDLLPRRCSAAGRPSERTRRKNQNRPEDVRPREEHRDRRLRGTSCKEDARPLAQSQRPTPAPALARVLRSREAPPRNQSRVVLPDVEQC